MQGITVGLVQGGQNIGTERTLGKRNVKFESCSA